MEFAPRLHKLHEDVRKNSLMFDRLYTTLAYRAPEMVDLYSGVAVGPPADIWALGCVLYGLCFFALPFGSGSALAIQTGRYTVPASAATSYSSRLLKLMHYMLTISGAERPDIYQVAALAFSLLGRPNPVQNVNSRRVPDWQNLSLPTTGLMDASSKSSSFSHPIASSPITTVNSRGEFAQAIRTSAISTLTTTETSVTTPTKTHAVSPSIARRRPRAVMNPPSTMRTTPVGGDSGGEPLPILAKPPNPPHSSTAFQNSIHSEGLLKPPQQPFGVTASTKSSPLHRVGHRRGLSEASALLPNAGGVRQTYSLGDLQPNSKSTNAKCATLRARVICSAANDIDGDLFGAAFDAIRNHGGSTRKLFSSNPSGCKSSAPFVFSLPPPVDSSTLRNLTLSLLLIALLLLYLSCSSLSPPSPPSPPLHL
ncbi:AP2-associated protein kinase [Echinococcus granulosus]|uniref:non-specific serine/threonine protein kinase n=1 Tax=Echinococcus granulosus TaxID=6210 RepID=W6UMR5_ECHGR|nr:AP2-associated protein kinase [Echinococcus granulosus]EUB59427.1 AP2-associated protein kinase [Echinococcus granulosus]